MKGSIIVTKENIKKYLKLYNKLDVLIKERELIWILEKGPSFQDWEIGKNTVEEQAIQLINDNKLKELRFYKKNLKRYLLTLKNNNWKRYYKYVIFKYVKRYSNEQIKDLLNLYDIYDIDRKVIQYLYSNLKKEAGRIN